MNTQSHAVLNLAILGHPSLTLPILVGAILPDAPMFVMYGWAKLIYRQSEQIIWTKTYYQTFWQDVTALFHSIPVMLLASLCCYSLHWFSGTILCLSMALHALLDLPVHHNDAHRHFFPFSNYRFISPISYWDPRHHGHIVSLVEQLLVFVATLYLFKQPISVLGAGLLIAVNGIHLGGTLFFRVIRPRRQKTAANV